LAVTHDAGQGHHFSQPSAVLFAFDFNRERHAGNVPSGPAISQGDRPDAAGSAFAPQAAQVTANALAGSGKAC
jgi:hypothetical protein